MRALARTLAAVAVLAALRASAAPRVPVLVDPRLETLGFVHLLAGGRTAALVPPGGEWGKAGLREFARLKDHRAVRLTAALDEKKFPYINRVDALIRRGALPRLAQDLFTPDHLIEGAGGKEAFEAWVSALADFAREAKMEEFLRSDPAGRALVAEAESFARASDPSRGLKEMEALTGLPYRGYYTILLSPFQKPGGQLNAVVREPNGDYTIISVFGPEEGTSRFDPGIVPAIIGHEIAHGLTDDLADLLRERVDRSAGQFAKLDWDCYGSWRQCFRENAVRALMLRHIALTVGASAARARRREEGLDRFPYLDELERLLREEYEPARGRYPTIVEFFPRLIDSFPADPAPQAVVPAPAASGAGPGREWRFEAVEPFTHEGQRRRAAELLDRLVPRDAGKDLRLRRAALRLSLGDAEGAIHDADAVLRAAPRDPEALLARALALEAEGRAEEARAILSEAEESCREDAARAPLACADAARRRARGAGPGAPPPASWSKGEPGRPGGPYDLELDRRVELLAAALRAAGAASPHAGDPDEHARAMAELAAAHSTHPFVSTLRGLLDAEVPEIVLTQAVLSLGPPPALEESPSGYGLAGQLGGAASWNSFVSGLRAFARDSRFEEAWRRGEPGRRVILAKAWAETKGTLSTKVLSDWLGAPLPRTRLVVAPGLPGRFAANIVVGGVPTRVRSPYDARGLDLDSFGACPAHEILHGLTDELVMSARADLEPLSGLKTDACAPSWEGCVAEEVVLAVTLRALRRQEGEAEYARQLAYYEGRGYPRLAALGRRLAEFEDPAVRAKGFAAFFPRVVAHYRESLLGRARREAVRAVERRRELPAEPFEASFAADPRVELVSILLRLTQPPERRAAAASAEPEHARAADAAFLSFSSHPAAALTADLARRQTGLPLQLALYLSSAPGFPPGEPVPPDYEKTAGGATAARAWQAAAADFAREARFAAYWKAREPALAARSRAASARERGGERLRRAAALVGAPLSGRRVYAVAPLYAAEWGGRAAVPSAGGRSAALFVLGDPTGAPGEPRDAAVRGFLYETAGALLPPGRPARSIPEACAARTAAGWPTCVREHLVGAALAALEDAPGACAARQEAPFMPAACASFKAFVSRAGEGRDLRDLLPSFEDALAAEAAAGKAFVPPPAYAPAPATPREPTAAERAARRAKDEGVKLFVAGDAAGAEAAFRRALASVPEDPEALLDLGVALEARGDAAGSRRALDRAIEAAAPHRGLWEISAAALSSRAGQHARAGRRPAARADLSRALELAPKDWHGRADAERRLKELAP